MAGRTTGRLRVVRGPDRDLSADVCDQMIVGREDSAGFRLSDRDVSRQHFRIVMRQEGLELEDLGSSNGTKVNGRHVSFRPLVPGDPVSYTHLTLPTKRIV